MIEYDVIAPEMDTRMVSFEGNGSMTTFAYSDPLTTYGDIIINGVLKNGEFIDEDDYVIIYEIDEVEGLTLDITFEIAPEPLASIEVLYAYFEIAPDPEIDPDESTVIMPEEVNPDTVDYDEPVEDEEVYEVIMLPSIRADLTDALFSSDEMKTLVKQIVDYLDAKGILADSILVDEDTSIILVLTIDSNRYDLFKSNYLGDEALINELTSVFAIQYESGVDDTEFGVLSFSIITEPEVPDILECSFVGDGSTTIFNYEDETIKSGTIEGHGVLIDSISVIESEYTLITDISPEDGLLVTVGFETAPEDGADIDVLYTIKDDEEES